jgi:hypothetical protein
VGAQTLQRQTRPRLTITVSGHTCPLRGIGVSGADIAHLFGGEQF